ncbi:hypothetical protein NL676_034763 [Syzygium grande]|nr:hypothetical protein NL676_034763 [Syzygium grande]
MWWRRLRRTALLISALRATHSGIALASLGRGPSLHPGRYSSAGSVAGSWGTLLGTTPNETTMAVARRE